MYVKLQSFIVHVSLLLTLLETLLSNYCNTYNYWSKKND